MDLGRGCDGEPEETKRIDDAPASKGTNAFLQRDMIIARWSRVAATSGKGKAFGLSLNVSIAPLRLNSPPLRR